MRAAVEETIYSGEAVAVTPEMKKQALDSMRAEEAQVNLLRELQGLPPISYELTEEWADLPKKNKVLIIALIAGAALVVYYFYFRKK
jgi:hypothetical protein